MSPDVPGLVEASSNLARVEAKNGEFTCGTLQRSSVESSKADVAAALGVDQPGGDESVDGIGYHWVAAPPYRGNGLGRVRNIAVFLAAVWREAPALAAEIKEQVEIGAKYEGYIKRQLQQIQRSEKLEHRAIPDQFDYDGITGFSSEVREKLKRVRPASVGQASRISGVTPAAISLLLVAIERHRRQPSA
jgi:hypothetical protein